MEIKLNTDAGEKVIQMKNMKNKHVEKMLKVLKSMSGLEEDKAIVKLSELMETRNNIAMELAGLSEKEWADLDVEEAEKLTSIVAQKSFGDLDFSRLFKKRQG